MRGGSNTGSAPAALSSPGVSGLPHHLAAKGKKTKGAGARSAAARPRRCRRADRQDKAEDQGHRPRSPADSCQPPGADDKNPPQLIRASRVAHDPVSPVA